MDNITFAVGKLRFYSKSEMVAGAYAVLCLSLTVLFVILAETPLTIKYPLFFLPIALIAIISIVITKRKTKKIIEELKKEYKELEVQDENCRELLNFYENGTFFKGPEFGDRIIIIQIKPYNRIEICKILKENVEKIFKEK